MSQCQYASVHQKICCCIVVSVGKLHNCGSVSGLVACVIMVYGGVASFSCACRLQRVSVLFECVLVCAACPQVWVSQWPAAMHRAYLWVKLAQIHFLKSAFYSVSHNKYQPGPFTSKPLNNILRSLLNTCWPTLLSFFFLKWQSLCKATFF